MSFSGFPIKQFACWLAFILLAGGSVSALAQSSLQSGDELPEALKGIPPAGSSCKREDVIDAEKAPSAPKIAPDPACARSVQEIAALRAQPETILVDLRSPMEYQAFHVHNAASLSLSGILIKPYLRDKTLVLMGSGKAEADVYRACAQLKRAGYARVFVAQGGIIAWLLAGNEVQGRAVSASMLSQLSAAELWLEAQNPLNLVFLEKSRAALRSALPKAIVLEQNPDALRAQIAKYKSRHFPGVVLVTASKPDSEQIREMQQALQPLPLLFYSGTDAEFFAHTAQQEAIWDAQERGPKSLRCGP
ncbi:MAG: rhodanese-like domain-containing protein [Betaproteobacteria bacterium]|nr:rhodanese-like domain-containing protein [Betaproteobacteria bacterium]